LSTISTERDEVLQAVRDGYAVAFDLLAPIAGLDLESLNMTGGHVAELVFPDQNGLGATDIVLGSQIIVKGEEITQNQKRKRIGIPEWLMRRKGGSTLRKYFGTSNGFCWDELYHLDLPLLIGVSSSTLSTSS
jgi:hypothetical protein